MSGIRNSIAAGATAALLALSACPTMVNASGPSHRPSKATSSALIQSSRKAKKDRGTLRIKVSGLPSYIKADIRVTGPKKYSKGVTKTLKLKLAPGRYKVRVRAVAAGSLQFVPVKQNSLKARVKSAKTTRLTVRYRRSSSPAPTPTPTPRPTFDATVKWLPAERQRVACQSAPAPAVNELRLELCNKEGISLLDPSQTQATATRLADPSASSNLKAIEGNGTLSEAVTSGTITASGVKVGPTGKTYLTLTTPVNLDDTTSPDNQCAFLEVSEATGVPSCVDSSMRSVSSITFDNAGNVYYTGNATDSINTVLRKWDGASVRKLISNEAQLLNFAVTPDGYVIVSGRTGSTGSGWTRMVAANGGLSNVFSSSEARFISLYPDGNVYMGMWGNDQFGIRRLLGATKTVDPNYWTGGALNGNPAPPSYFPIDDFCPMGTSNGFCGSWGTMITKSVITQDGKVLTQAGSPGLSQTLMQYWPTVKYLNTAVKRVTTMEAAGQLLFLAGTNASGDNIATLYNPATDTEQVVIPASNQIEIYNASYSADARKVLFDGLRFADNQRVIGDIAVATGNVTVHGTSTGRLSDLQAF